MIMILMSRCGQVGIQLHESNEQRRPQGDIHVLHHAITLPADWFELGHQ
jgi:hypothetical protein